METVTIASHLETDGKVTWKTFKSITYPRATDYMNWGTRVDVGLLQ